jgi:hypothetical protein
MKTTIKRRAVAAAFRRMANGVKDKAAYANTVGFYRASGQIRGQGPNSLFADAKTEFET